MERVFFSPPPPLFFSLCCPLWARKIIDFYTRSQLPIWTSSVVDQFQRGNQSSRGDKSAWESLSSFPFSRDRFQKHMAFGCQLAFGICTPAESLFGLACFDAGTTQPTFLLINHSVILCLNQLWSWAIFPRKDQRCQWLKGLIQAGAEGPHPHRRQGRVQMSGPTQNQILSPYPFKDHSKPLFNSAHEELCSESNFIVGVGIPMSISLICASVLAFGGCNPLPADGKCQPNSLPLWLMHPLEHVTSKASTEDLC